MRIYSSLAFLGCILYLSILGILCISNEVTKNKKEYSRRNIVKKLILFVMFVCLLLGACTQSPIVDTPTVVPSKVLTPSPTATPSPTPFVWSCENDPVKGLAIELGGMYEQSLENRYVPKCEDYAWPLPINEERYRINFLHKSFQAISPDNSFVSPIETTVKREIYFEDFLVPHPAQKKGDLISFEMPAPGFFLLLGHANDFWGGGPGSSVKDNIRITINDEEWFVSSGILLSSNGEYIVPKGAIVQIEALQDATVDLNGLQSYGTLAWIEAIVFERTYPEDMARTSHTDLNNSTQIDLGAYGIFKPTFNETRSKWSFSLSEESMVQPGIWEEGLLKNFITRGGAFIFYMPADGMVFWNTRDLTPYIKNNQAGYGWKENNFVARLYAKGDLVILHFDSAVLEDFYVEFLN